jgi:ribose-phosphate pyrophosphokinase
MELCLLARAAKSFGATHVIAIVPYLGYSRQDKITIHGEINTRNCLLDMMQVAGVDRVLSADLHSQRELENCTMKVINLETTDVFTHLVGDVERSVIIAPDKGAYNRARAMAKRLKVPALMVEKKRLGPGKMKITSFPDSKHVQHCDCYIVDDILDTGGTVCAVARALKKAGARSVTVFVSHGLFSQTAAETIQRSPIERIYVTNSIAYGPEERPKTIALDISHIIADYLAVKENV